MTKENKLSMAVGRHCDEIIGWASDLVAIPSRQGQEAAAQDYLRQSVAALGADSIDVWEPEFAQLKEHPAFISNRSDFSGSPNLAATWRGSGGGRSLILSSHIDVVPEGDPKQWRHDPFSGKVEDGVIYGRGISDMKGTLASMLGAISALRELQVNILGDLTIISTIEEETGGCGALSAVLRGYKADAAVVPEPSGFAICPAQQGGAKFHIFVQGKSAHAGERLKGISAVDKIDPVRVGIANYERYLNENFRSVYYKEGELPFSVNVGVVNGGDWFCTVPEKATIEGRLAVPPGLTVEESLEKLKEFVYQQTDSDPWLRNHRPEINLGKIYWQPAQIPIDSQIVKVAQEAYLGYFEKAAVVKGTPWGTDGRMFTEFAGTQSVVFGPGTSAHCPNEFVKVGDLIDYSKVLVNIIALWCGTKEPICG
jgi:acetylornithine deacetylase